MTIRVILLSVIYGTCQSTVLYMCQIDLLLYYNNYIIEID